jgi:predicted DCC family thiol-disulfide oxidoreductase YuxK
MTQQSLTPVTVYYDGSCPLCRREIAVYQRAEGGDSVNWCDVSQADAPLGGISTEQAMARFHVRGSDGMLQDGARAFIALWLSLPRWRWLGRVASIPPVPVLLEGLYRAFLPMRPLLQKMVRSVARP